MSKRDTIIVAVLINIGLLAVLFMVAMNSSEDRVADQSEISYTLEDTPSIPATPGISTPTTSGEMANTSSQPIALSGQSQNQSQTSPRDELDDVLSSYTEANPAINIIDPSEVPMPTPVPVTV